ncbi:MAG: hypothetical protein LBL36_00115 [Clostridiales Family XIII bacterium]|jgi:hypothetical protein|nr:hypothetical protein [Clostridiales Family XIII bacterium]
MENTNQNNYEAAQINTEAPAPPAPPAQTQELPFIPKQQESGKVKAVHAKIIIILLACILAVNIATLVTQFIPFGASSGFGNMPITIERGSGNGNGDMPIDRDNSVAGGDSQSSGGNNG